MMNTGKIMIGFSLILLSIAMMVSPSGATGFSNPCDVGCGIFMPLGEIRDVTCIQSGFPTIIIDLYPQTDATYPYER
jgi:hypothetical protein